MSNKLSEVSLLANNGVTTKSIISQFIFYIVVTASLKIIKMFQVSEDNFPSSFSLYPSMKLRKKLF